MTEKSGDKGRKMLVLGFDAGCGTCAGIARRVEERVGDQLSVRNLGDPEVMGWREEALGKDAPWVPTLFEVDGDEVRAWTGRKMALPLSRKLGLSNTWQLMQVLGEMPNAGIPTMDTAPADVGMSRGSFLKGVGGAAVAMSVLSGVGPLVSVAEAAKKKGPYDVVSSTSLKGAELQSLAKRIALNPDMKAIAGNALSTTAKIKASKPSAGRVKLRNGTFITTIVYGASKQRTMVHATYSRPIGRAATSIAKAVVRDGRELVVTKVSEGGYLWRRPASVSARAGSRTAPLEECPPEFGSEGGPPCAVYYTPECVKEVIDYDCLDTTAAECLVCVGSAGLTIGTSGGYAVFGGITAVGSCRLCLKDSDCYTCELYARVRRIDYSRC